MKDPPFTIIYEPAAALQVQRERVWLCNNRGRERADAFEDDLAHFLDLLSCFPYMGDASPENEDERHWFLRRSRLHVFYSVYELARVVRIVRLRHERQDPRSASPPATSAARARPGRPPRR